MHPRTNKHIPLTPNLLRALLLCLFFAFLAFGFWKPKEKILLFLASKIKSQKSTYLGAFFWLLPKPKSQKKPQQKGPQLQTWDFVG
jgi:hypothetical protein